MTHHTDEIVAVIHFESKRKFISVTRESRAMLWDQASLAPMGSMKVSKSATTDAAFIHRGFGPDGEEVFVCHVSISDSGL